MSLALVVRKGLEPIDALVHLVDRLTQAIVQYTVFVEEVLLALIFEQVFNPGDVDLLIQLFFVFMDRA